MKKKSNERKTLTDGLQPGADYWRATVPLHFSIGQYACYTTTENMNISPEPSWRSLNSYDEECTSTGVIIVGNYVDNEYVLVGALTAFRSFTHLIVRNRGSVPFSIEVRQEDIPGDGSCPSEKLIVLEGNDWIQLLLDYSCKAAEANSIQPIGPRKNLTGYCSWYYYFDQITEDQFLQNTARMAIARKNMTFDASFMQIDDGYQTFQGDWTCQNEAWPTPLKETAAKVISMGFTPGIWIMPFVASTESRIFHRHPDWFVKNASDDNARLAYGWTPERDNEWACLDTTHPDVIQHLKKLFRTFHEWGFRYFKLDGLANAMIDGHRNNPEASPLSAFRDGLVAIREAVPEDYLLAATSPFLPCLGMTDGVKVSGGEFNGWKESLQTWKAMVSRYWMFDQWYQCDPNIVTVRPHHHGNPDIAAARFLALNAILTGVCITGDRMEELEPARLQLLTIASRFRMRNVRPLAWPLNSWPFVFTGTLNGKKAIAVFNWTDEPIQFSRKELGIQPGDKMAFILGTAPGAAFRSSLALDPHDAALISQR